MIMYMSLIDNEDNKIKFEDIYNKYIHEEVSYDF